MFTVYNSLLVFLFASSAFAYGEEVVERLRWTGNSDAVVYSVIAVAVVVVILIIIYTILQEKNKEKQIRDFANFQFAQKAKETNLTVAEQTLLKSITWSVAPKMLADVFGSLVIFEAAVDIEIKKLIETLGDDNPKTESTADTIRRIRRKLGFSELVTERALESTRNIEHGQIISIFSPIADGNSEMNFAKTRVLNNYELYFEADFAELEDFFSKNGRQSGVIARFTRNQDANYSVHLPIREINRNENIISFYHTTALERHQARKYARFSVDAPVQCRIIKRASENSELSAGDFLKEATLSDISGGGLSFISKSSLAIDDIAIFTFTLQGQKIMMKGKIVAISVQDGKFDVFYKHRVIFFSPKQSDVERIVKFIYEKQREKIQLR